MYHLYQFLYGITVNRYTYVYGIDNEDSNYVVKTRNILNFSKHLCQYYETHIML